jgi:hypothetical protein
LVLVGVNAKPSVVTVAAEVEGAAVVVVIGFTVVEVIGATVAVVVDVTRVIVFIDVLAG